MTTDTQQRGFEAFLEVQWGLPRQGPGTDAATAHALSCCVGLPRHPEALDVGCGPGRQTVTLAKNLTGRVTAVDLHQPYLDELAVLAAHEGVRDRIEIVCADMNALPFAAESFDLLWSEGAAYIMGFAQALTAWRPLLRPGGCVAVSEVVWLRPEPPPALSEFFAEEYPTMTDAPTTRRRIAEAGYQNLAQFTLPEAAWWEQYYAPLERKLPSLRARYAGDHEALRVVEATEREIDLRRRFGDWYGYVFFIAQRSAEAPQAA